MRLQHSHEAAKPNPKATQYSKHFIETQRIPFALHTLSHGFFVSTALSHSVLLSHRRFDLHLLFYTVSGADAWRA